MLLVHTEISLQDTNSRWSKEKDIFLFTVSCYKPCPFGLIKSLDPIVVIFFKKCQKNYKCWIKCISKKFTTTGSANTCNFFGNEKILISKKITTMGSKHHLNPIVVFFFEIKIFSFSKKITSVGWSSRCKFFWNGLDPTLVIFLTFFEKNYNDWIKSKLSKSKFKWTGLLLSASQIWKLQIFPTVHQLYKWFWLLGTLGSPVHGRQAGSAMVFAPYGQVNRPVHSFWQTKQVTTPWCKTP